MPLNPGLLDSPGLYLTGEDNLRLTTFGALAGAVVALEGRMVDADGRTIALAERQVPNSDYTAKVTIFPLREGILSHAQLRISTGAAARGVVFAILELVRGVGTSAQALGTLLQGYVTTNGRLAWPGSPIVESTAGVGRLRSITGVDPAAGVEITETVPANVRWLVHAFTASLVTDATVANRIPRLVVDDGVAVLASIDSAVLTPASTNHRHSWLRGAGAGINTASGSPTSVAPTIPLGPGFRLRTSTLGIVAGDNWSAPQYLVEEFIET